MICKCLTAANCDDAFQVNSSCYKVHKNETVNWFTAVNRCLSNNASLAGFDDDVHQYFPSSLLTDPAWIGLVKSWWTWPALSKLELEAILQNRGLGFIPHRIPWENVKFSMETLWDSV